MRQLEKEHTNTNILGMVTKTRGKEGRSLQIIQTEKPSEIDALLKEQRVLENAMIQVVSVQSALEKKVEIKRNSQTRKIKFN